ncbi:TrmH family RNA methyltransferase [Phaeodactylibacter luteus]|uniref:TrmH family RNA methyltransferase n=1 Tax=Phaeodactylibacter luteus TaxID=1564516 RepID=UPI001FE79A4E|nr:RNA methyltransferase [Phaeodactylibacter luteus]
MAARRQPNLTVILENVHDPHNIGAVLRSCDSVGIREVFILYTAPDLAHNRIEIGRNASSGARKWLDIHMYHDVEACFKHVKSNYEHIWATHLGEAAVDLYDIDFTGSVALLFGNEHDGVSGESLAHATGNFIIPQMGMVQSLNISVACAVTLYEALRQRRAADMYGAGNLLSASERDALQEAYLERHTRKNYNKFVRPKQP